MRSLYRTYLLRYNSIKNNENEFTVKKVQHAINILRHNLPDINYNLRIMTQN